MSGISQQSGTQQSTDCGLVVVGPSLRVSLWNTRMEDISGIKAHLAQGETLHDLFPGSSMHELQQSVEQLLSDPREGKHPESFQVAVSLEKNGPKAIQVILGINLFPLTDGATGQHCLMQIVDLTNETPKPGMPAGGMDIEPPANPTQQHCEKSASAIVDNIQDALITVDTDDRVFALNNAARKLFCIHDESHIIGNLDSLFPYYRGHLLTSHKHGASYELIGLRMDGSEFPAEVGVSELLFGEVAYRVLIVRDLTDKKRAEEDLFREKEFAQTTLQSIHEAVITTDERGRVHWANASACSLLRKSVEEVVERPLLDLLTFSELEHRQSSRKALKNALSQGTSSALEGTPELRFEDGETLYVTAHLSSLRDSDTNIIGSVMVLQDVTLEKRMKEILSYQATHDELTSLINRREFERQLDELLQNQTPERNDILLYLDLDQFKLINDNCGHDAGDLLLKQLTGLLRTRLRHTDTLARLGGDEFAALLPSCDLEVGRRIADELRETVRNYRFNWDGRNFAIGVSIGLVCIDTSMGNTASVLAAADSACYIAKENGRDQVVSYQADGNEEQKRRDEMTQAATIRDSLEKQRFTLFAQPIVPVNLLPDSPWGVEILVRMFDEQGKMVPPMAFIPPAERYNLMSHVDRWVIDALFAHWQSKPDWFNKLDKVAVNLSGQSVANDEFLSYLLTQVESKGIPWEKLCFEITETAAVASIEKAQHFMNQLAARGARFALDDFGSGLSSFTYLKHLPVDYLKIDGAFVRDMLNDEIDAAMVRSISDIGHAMGLDTIAEFVEDQQVLQALHDARVDFAQGYGICKPMPIEDIHSFTPCSNVRPIIQSA